MSLKLYMIAGSPPVRAVLMCAKALSLPLDLINVDLSKNEQLTPKYLKINPQHTVPTLNDKGFILWDSHAIMAYLTGKYSKDDDTLYPKDIQKRAVVDQRMYFDASLLFPRCSLVLRDIVFDKKKEINPCHISQIDEAYSFLNTFLEGKQWLANDNVTIGDISIGATISSTEFIVPIKDTCPRLREWYKNFKEQPFYEANLEGLKNLKDYVYACLGK